MCNTCKHSENARTSTEMPNKFQTLIESPGVQPYSAEERLEKTVEINADRFASNILPAIQAAAETHVETRRHVIESKVEVDS